MNISKFAGVAIAAVLSVNNVNAAPVFSPSVFTIADCDPSNLSSGLSPSSFQSCSTADASAKSETSYTSMKAQVEVNTSGQPGDYFAANKIRDNVDVNPIDTGLIGQAGTLQFAFDIEGSLGGTDSNVLFQVSDAVQNPGGSISSRRKQLSGSVDLFDSMGGLISVIDIGGDRFSFSNSFTELLTLSGRITATIDVIFGDNVSYDIDQLIGADVPGTFSDFFGTTTLSAVSAYTIAGMPVEVELVTAGGVDLAQLNAPSEVPIPGAIPLMLSGLMGLRFMHRKGRVLNSSRGE